jgi:hypothetical protein
MAFGAQRDTQHFGDIFSMSAGPGQTSNAPYQQGDPRDTSGMQ